jgi:hypothetical protein
MPITYGPNEAFETARTVIVTQLTALIAAMAAVSPKLTAVFSTHLADPALTFNSATVGIPAFEMEFPAMKSSPAGPVINILAQVEIRVLIGNRNAFMDEITISRLCNSVVNWFEEHRNLGSSFVLWKTARVETAVRFEDTDTIGGRVTLVIRSTEAYVAA